MFVNETRMLHPFLLVTSTVVSQMRLIVSPGTQVLQKGKCVHEDQCAPTSICVYNIQDEIPQNNHEGRKRKKKHTFS